jgi:hypothetical protein
VQTRFEQKCPKRSEDIQQGGSWWSVRLSATILCILKLAKFLLNISGNLKKAKFS